MRRHLTGKSGAQWALHTGGIGQRNDYCTLFCEHRGAHGRGEDRLDAVEDLATVASLIRHLSEIDSSFNELSESPNPPLISVNQVLQKPLHPLLMVMK